MPIIKVDHLQKRYGDTIAVSDVSLSIEEGEIFGILGPNGAGKTTTVECIAGLREPDAGTVEVMGLDPLTDREALRRVLGIQLQETQQPDKLKVGEALELYASFYSEAADPDELLEVLGLADKRQTRFAKLSGGQKQRLSIALALIGRPRIAILDELTTGLDPVARRDTWALIDDIRKQGVTIMLVTHFMTEAERLCDRVAILEAGRVAAIGTPAELARPTLEDTFVALTAGRR
jgi:ABC-2 type transport system ATP-binding protein